MLAEASAPPNFDDAEESGECASATEQQHEASAPVLTDDEYGGQHESLPKYER
jgi:hypothetical protein